jgi:two-component system cell cycle sensor histidine kinase/response regulator CckA
MRGNKILLAEDSATQAEVLKAVLEDHGLAVTHAASGEEALAELMKSHYDLVVSDVVMPGMSGYDLCRAVKGRAGTAEIPVVLLTSLTDPMAIVRGLECGADNYVTKPYTPEYLLARIRNTLDRYTLRPSSKTSMGVNVQFLDTQFTITSDREQILDLFISSIEDVVRTNDALQASQRELAQAQRQLEDFASRMAHQAQVTAEKYSALMHSASDAIFVLDDAGTIVEANARASELLDRNARNLRGSKLDELAAPESRAALRAQLDRVAGLARITASDVEFRRGDESRIYCDLSASRARTRDGELTLVILHDVTERRQLEHQLLHAQKMEAIGQLAGGIAHDFNNLLTVIASYVDLACEQTAKDSPIRADLDEIRHAADSATALTRQLLAFSRKQILQPRPLRLADVARSVERMLGRLIGEHIQLVMNLEGDDAQVMADPGQVEQLLMNLAVNARDAMPQGGQLVITTASREMSAADVLPGSDIQPGAYQALTVSDTGIGMDAEIRDRIFEPFFTTKAQGQGTGLGLSTVYGIVKQSEGSIEVRSDPGHGTTFTILLPRLTQSGRREHLSNPRMVAISRQESGAILLVEDERQLRALARRVLERAGYRVFEAADGEEAVGMCAELKDSIDLVLTDVVMPRMTARDMVEQLAGVCGGAPVLFMSGYAGDDVLRRGLADPGMNFLQKPFTPQTLLAKVREVMLNESGAGTS